MRTVVALLVSCAGLSAQIDSAPRIVPLWPTGEIKVSTILPASYASSGCQWYPGTNCSDAAPYLNACLDGTAEPAGGPPNWPCPSGGSTLGTPIHLLFDISVGIGSPIKMLTWPYVTLEGLGSQITGIYVMPGANSTAICNAYSGVLTGCQGGPGVTQSQAGAVSIRHLAINVNRGGGNSTSGDPRCASFCEGINLANLALFETEDVYIYDSPYFAILDTNIGNQLHHADRIVSPTLSANTDGFHFNGPNGWFSISDTYLATGDDSIAVNAPEGPGGNIAGGTISNIVENGSLSVLREYTYAGSGAGYFVGPVILNGVTGNLAIDAGVQPQAIKLGFINGPGQVDSIQSLQISNMNLSGMFSLMAIYEHTGPIDFWNCTWNPTNGTAAPGVIWYAGATASHIGFHGFKFYRNPAGHTASYLIQVGNTVTLKRLELDGVDVLNEQGQTYAALPYLIDVPTGGLISELTLKSVDPTLAPTLLNGNEWAQITSFIGTGIESYYRNTTFANLPPATYVGLAASIRDSTTQVWGATAAGGSSSFARVGSNGTNWTVTGK